MNRKNLCNRIILQFFCLSAAFVPCAASNESWLVTVHQSSDTDKILPLVREGLSGIPASLKDQLFAAGYKVVVTPTMLYGQNGDNLERRSAYDVGSSYNIAGQFRPRDHTLYIPERCAWGNDVPRLQDSRDLPGVLRHEFGHAVDCFLNYPSQGGNFMESFNSDYSKLTNTQLTQFSYFTQQQPGTNSTELFAELFDIICCNDDRTLRSYDRHLYEAFPHCVNAILCLNVELHPHTFPNGSATANRSSEQTDAKAAAVNRTVNIPTAASSPLQTATQLLSSHAYPQAIQCLNAIIAKEPSNGLAHNYRGYAYFGLGNYKQAIQDYSEALRLNPQDTNAAQYLKVAKQYAGTK